MENKLNQEALLARLDLVMRQLRRRPEGSRHGGRGTHRVLRLILENPGLSTRQLAERMDIRPSSLNELLARLETEGMISRERDPRDQRVHLVRLEPAGIAHLQAVQVFRAQMNEAIGGILTRDEIREMIRLADKLAKGLEGMENADTPGGGGEIHGE